MRGTATAAAARPRMRRRLILMRRLCATARSIMRARETRPQRPCARCGRSAVSRSRHDLASNSIAAKGDETRREDHSMRHLFAASLLVCAFALPVAAQDEGPPVPVDKAAYHVPVFRNEYLTVLRVNIPSQRSAGYHIHSKDQISVLVEEADQSGQVLGEQPTPPRRTPRGNVTFTAYSKKSMTH